MLWRQLLPQDVFFLLLRQLCEPLLQGAFSLLQHVPPLLTVTSPPLLPLIFSSRQLPFLFVPLFSLIRPLLLISFFLQQPIPPISSSRRPPLEQLPPPSFSFQLMLSSQPLAFLISTFQRLQPHPFSFAQQRDQLWE